MAETKYNKYFLEYDVPPEQAAKSFYGDTSVARFDYNVTGGTASGNGTDYTLTAGTATIAAGATTVDISMTVVNDIIDEPNETDRERVSNARMIDFTQ